MHQSAHSFETADAASLSASPGMASVEVNFDTGAAVTVLPEKDVTQPKDNGVRYKTASGEALRDEGKAEVTNILPGGRVATIRPRGRGSPRTPVWSTLRFCKGQEACWSRREVLSPRRQTRRCANWPGNTNA